MTDIINQADLRELLRLLYEDGLKLDEALPLLRINQTTFDLWCDEYPDEDTIISRFLQVIAHHGHYGQTPPRSSPRHTEAQIVVRPTGDCSI